ncbi:MAG: hypothetical protein ABIH83_03325 [Candidatus Micrarchaeota archaeon]
MFVVLIFIVPPGNDVWYSNSDTASNLKISRRVASVEEGGVVGVGVVPGEEVVLFDNEGVVAFPPARGVRGGGTGAKPGRVVLSAGGGFSEPLHMHPRRKIEQINKTMIIMLLDVKSPVGITTKPLIFLTPQIKFSISPL